ncbi:DUF3560 domain-containing protein [Bacteroides sp.]|uniref:DUF3560 domain-containing protein n=1 Tax=Bacteroides sp. TaxID=29523 RepID=UPI00262570CF|nr:DUF3560 domain-containing protein [Bacteroides sp.]
MNRKEKQAARAERCRGLAYKANQQSTDAYNQSHKMVENIPFGQPILVGHHSERGHRNLLVRSWNTMGKSVKLSKKAEYYERKAEAAENNDNIYLEDDDAVDRLQEKINSLEKAQLMMKAANKIVRNTKLSDAAKIEQLHELGYSTDKAPLLLKPNYAGCIGFPSYSLSNNNARIHDAKTRLERAKQLKATATKEYTINGVRVVENTEDNRLQLFFNSIPSAEMRSNLKHNGFRWSPTNGCWQSYLKCWQIDCAKALLNTKSE